MSRVIGHVLIDGVCIELTLSDPAYGTGFGWGVVSPAAIARQRTGYDTIGAALDAAWEYVTGGVVA